MEQYNQQQGAYQNGYQQQYQRTQYGTYQQPPQQPCPESYLAWAIITTIFCCLPLGIFSIVKAASVERLWLQGRYEEAYRASRSAKLFAIWSAIIPAIVFLLYIILLVIGIDILSSWSESSLYV